MLKDIPESTVEDVLSSYGLARPWHIKPVAASTRNDKFLVDDAERRRFVLRRNRRVADEARIRFQLQFQQHLLDSGFPTSSIVESISGDSLVTDELGGLWALFTYVEGDEYNFSRMEQVKDAARRLAQLHSVSDSFRGEDVVIAANRWGAAWLADGNAELAALEDMFSERGVQDDLDFVRQWANGASPEVLAHKDVIPNGWVHGDYHGRNMVFVNDEIQGVFDFDPVTRGWRTEDVAYAMFMFGRESRLSRRIRDGVASAFLVEYRKHHRLSAEELRMLPITAVAIWVTNASYCHVIERDGEDPAAYFRRHVSLMRDVGAEFVRLQRILDLPE